MGMWMRMLSWAKGALPFAAMVMTEFCEVGVVTLSKAVMNGGLSNLVFVVYSNALGALILFPCVVFKSCRGKLPPLTLSLLCRFFLLGLIGISFVQVFGLMGINFSSPTLATSMANLIVVFTFLLAVIFRMEKLDLRKSSSQAKSLGTIIALSGAFIITFYTGPIILMSISASNLPHRLVVSQQSKWVLGGLIFAINCMLISIWNIFQTATVKEYPEAMTIVFFYCCFGTIQSAIITLAIERNPSAWMLYHDIDVVAILFSALFSCVLRNYMLTWCLNKRGPFFVALFKPVGMVIAAIFGVMFLGDALHLGSVIGAFVIAVGFYTVMWGQARERAVDVDHVCRVESSAQSTPLLGNGIAQNM